VPENGPEQADEQHLVGDRDQLECSHPITGTQLG
jgi:hypothetical protein